MRAIRHETPLERLDRNLEELTRPGVVGLRLANGYT
jgi:hypothetical protein